MCMVFKVAFERVIMRNLEDNFMALSFPNIDPVAVALGPLQIRWYALSYLAGILLGWFVALRLSRMSEARPHERDIEDFVPWAVLGVILGGRLGYVLFYNLSYYLDNPLQLLQVWQGGMSFHGGASGVFVAIIAYGIAKKINVLRLGDIVAVVAPIGLFFGRLANFVNGELFGRVTDAPWGMVFPRGGGFARHPSQLYEAVLEGALLFVILFALYRIAAVRGRSGVVSGVFLIGYGAARLVVEFFREPDAHIGLLGGFISMGQVLSLPMILAGALLVLFALTRKSA